MKKFFVWLVVFGLASLLVLAFGLYLGGKKDAAKFLLELVSAVGVLSAVAFALYPEPLKNVFNPLQLEIVPLDPPENFANRHAVNGFKEVDVYLRHLKVINHAHDRPIQNCQVWLTRVEHGTVSNAIEFEERYKYAVPRLMQWAPSEYSPDKRSFSTDQVLDFGRIFVDPTPNRTGGFEIYYFKEQEGAFEGFCPVGEARRYHFRITGDNYVSPHDSVIELHVLQAARAQENRPVISVWIGPATKK